MSFSACQVEEATEVGPEVLAEVLAEVGPEILAEVGPEILAEIGVQPPESSEGPELDKARLSAWRSKAEIFRLKIIKMFTEKKN